MSSQITPLFPVSGTDTAKVQGIPVSTVDPINGQVLVYKSATLQYEPDVPSGVGANEITLGTTAVGTVAEVSRFTLLGDPVGWTAKYFTIGVPTGQAYVWFDRDGSAGDPAPAGFVRGIGIDPGDFSVGSAAANRAVYANHIVSVFNGDPDLSASRNSDVITLTSRATGARSDITLGTFSGGAEVSVAVLTQGVETGGALGAVVLKSGNAVSDVSIKNIGGNIRFERAAGNIDLGSAAGRNVGQGSGNLLEFNSEASIALGTNNVEGKVRLNNGNGSFDISSSNGDTDLTILFSAIAGGYGAVTLTAPLENGAVANITAAANTANRTYTLPDASGTFVLAGGAGAFTSLSMTGDLTLAKTITASGTTGAQTINKSSGTVNFAAAASSLVVTNSLVTVNSIIQLTVGTNDTTMRSAIAVAAAGSFTIYPTAAPTAQTRVNFTITN